MQNAQSTLSALLEIAIVIVGIYAALSWIVSAVHERVADVLSLRGQKLYQGVLNLVSGHDAFAALIFDHPLVTASSDDRAQTRNPLAWIGYALSITHPPGSGDPTTKAYRPSYLDARTFSMSFWAQLAELAPPAAAGAPAPTDVCSTLVAGLALPPPTVAALQRSLAKIETANPELYASCRALLSACAADYDKLLRVTDGWFNGQMDRVSGWYKRQTGVIIAILSLMLVSFAGIDSVEMAKKLYSDPDARAMMAAQLSAAVSGTATGCKNAATDKTPEAKLAAQQQNVNCVADKLAANVKFADWVHPSPWFWTTWRGHELGMLVTVAALALGGPVWFGILLKLVNVRSSGRRPQRADAPPT